MDEHSAAMTHTAAMITNAHVGGEMAQQLRALSTLPGDLGSLLSTHVGSSQLSVTLAPGDPTLHLLSCLGTRYTCDAQTYKTYG